MLLVLLRRANLCTPNAFATTNNALRSIHTLTPTSIHNQQQGQQRVPTTARAPVYWHYLRIKLNTPQLLPLETWSHNLVIQGNHSSIT